ncbi:hypothetical protein CVIRNUC_001781 [Coccomyxa viridis]|uniref:Cyclin-dependent kinase inhibitor domain-containing protein n=1 Tax=Coccomyxa viridis TaxID=1274662 RepID=A0AAV1HVK2_9CHLO|nr:hypothetical protein CVIRNUC_001781 [Coccomyxa viridis]
MAGEKASEGKRKLPEPPESMVTPDKKMPVPTGSAGSSARRILFNDVHHKKEMDDISGGEEAEEVQSRSRLYLERNGRSRLGNSAGSSGGQRQVSRLAARTLFGNMPSREQMNRFFETTEQQVRQAFQERWGVDPNSDVVLSNGQWQWAFRNIVSGDQLKPLM